MSNVKDIFWVGSMCKKREKITVFAFWCFMMMVNWQYIKIAYLICIDHRESPSTTTEDNDVEENAESHKSD